MRTREIETISVRNADGDAMTDSVGQTLDLRIVKRLDPYLAITANPDEVSYGLTHLPTTHLVAQNPSLSFLLDLYRQIKGFDWDIQLIAKCPAETREKVQLILDLLKKEKGISFYQ